TLAVHGNGMEAGNGMKANHDRTFVRAAIALALAASAAPAAAQVPGDTTLPSGVQLKLVYETQYRPRLAVQPFGGADVGGAAEEAHRIVQRDLDYSDRFDMLFSIPAALRQGADYSGWNGLGVVYLVTGGMERSESDGWRLRLALHDVVYGSVKEIRLFDLPPADDDAFRMAVHAVSDEVVRWATGEPGMAATRIALTRHLGDGTYELLMVDSDGENLERVDTHLRLYSPAWSPDGRRLAYQYGDEERNSLVERDLRTGRVKTLTEARILAQTPSYAPDGEKLAIALWVDRGMEIHEYDVARDCCLRRLSRRPRIDMHPSYSPDGRRLAFQSDRLGNPQIFTMEAGGGDAILITAFEVGGAGYYTSPEWSPRASQLVFHGRSRGGVFQIMIADANRPGAPVQQITSQGRSEDPSWAPDGRHIVFSGVREDGMGLYVIDLVTGRIRPLVTGGRYRMPAWSPQLADAAPLAARP
ncbi:MAG TPA: hypothetical protein VMM83_01750, partial [Longimicrobiales bacterium]|nr:hypothetical protein [Longimicrobiales bacterium]